MPQPSPNPPGIKYYITDHLHSTAVFADKSGTVLDDNDFYPWGGAVSGVGTTTSNNHYKFTGKERDTESGLDYFGARYYANVTGRFMSPDWAAKPTSVPYAEFGDPQSLNLYSYVRNSPVVRVDADGHQINDFNNMGFQNGLDEWGDGNWNGRMGEGYQPEGGGQPSAGSKSSSQVKNLNVTSNFSLTTEEQYVIESVFREANIQIHFVDAKKAQVTIINKELNETYTGDISKLKLGEAAPGAKYVYVDLKAVVTVANSPAVRSMAHVSYDAAVGRVIAHELGHHLGIVGHNPKVGLLRAGNDIGPSVFYNGPRSFDSGRNSVGAFKFTTEELKAIYGNCCH